jgi:hypothetical protein
MTQIAELLLVSVILGIGGAALMDLWGVVARRILGVQGLDYALLGRWIAHMPRGRFFHERIAAAEAIRGERVLGWMAHYAIGIGFAAPLVMFWGSEWVRHPTLGPPMLIGMATIAAPWLVMQPAMGAGLAASRTPKPWTARLRNLVTHAVYGLGLYVTAMALSLALT